MQNFQAIIYQYFFNLHDCTFKLIFILMQLSEMHEAVSVKIKR